VDKLRDVMDLYGELPAVGGGSEVFLRAWREGFLHVLRSAPRTRWGRWRIRLGAKAEFVGPAVMIVCGYVGDYDNIYSTLRVLALDCQPTGAKCPCRPFFELLSLKMQPALQPTILSAILSLESLARLPQVIQEKLDEEQLGVLLGIGQSQHTLHFLEAFAGTGKSVVGRCVVFSFVLHGPQDRILAYVTATRDLRDDVVLSITEGLAEGAPSPQQQAAGGSQSCSPCSGGRPTYL
jgi:hypothetical protein